MWQKIELQPMETAPKNEMIMIDAGYGFLTAGHWNETEQSWVFSQMKCNDAYGNDVYFENEYETKPVGWFHIPTIRR